MIELTLFKEEAMDRAGSLFLNPADVMAVEEREDRRAYGGYNLTARITMRNGDKFLVYDAARTVAAKFREAMKEKSDGE